ncbi:MAG: TIGR02206 family membrane protein [Candidatus Marinimicrobia bacterium]|nr:TIGR02206 family membrane protein [Candidatus Neomarinimicrobiota bacterium]MCF7903602.1 TIGR02206 family membrane protein [Candidatus Neomarinimicrobiota bacterium]
MPESFVLFGSEHFTALAVIFIIALGPPIILKQTNRPALNRNFALVLGVVMFSYTIFKHLYGVFVLREPWQIWLPLHMCHIANFFLIYLLLTGKRGFLVEVAYFWTFAGASMALITPDLAFGWPDPNYIMFMVTHGLLLLAMLYFTITEGLRPTSTSIWRVFKFSVIGLLIILPINYLVGPLANYWYLRAPPVSGSLMDLLPPPPGHIPFVMLLGYFAFWIVYTPYLIRDAVFRNVEVESG